MRRHREIIETGHGDYADEILKLNELAKISPRRPLSPMARWNLTAPR